MFKFTNQDQEFAAEIDVAFKPAFRGWQAENIKENRFPVGHKIVELWMNPFGDFVSFQTNGPTIPETIFVCFNETRCFFSDDVGFQLARQLPEGGFEPTDPPHEHFIENALIFLTNFTRPTQRIKQITNSITRLYFSGKKRRAS
jgi:hypothetical protein